MMDGGWVFLDIDTQVDFMLPHGALYVPGAEQIIPNLRALMVYAQEHQIPVLSSADAHAPDDPSFAQWPPHCVVGTEGQRRIPETQLSPSLVIPNRLGALLSSGWPPNIAFRPQCSPCSAGVLKPLWSRMLFALSRRRALGRRWISCMPGACAASKRRTLWLEAL